MKTTEAEHDSAREADDEDVFTFVTLAYALTVAVRRFYSRTPVVSTALPYYQNLPI
jgi:hypothetical protein